MTTQQEDTHSDHSHRHFPGGGGHKTELYVAIGAGILWVAGWMLPLLRLIPQESSIYLYVPSILLGGIYPTWEAISELRKGKFQIDFLMIIAAAGAAALGNWGEGALLLFLFSLGHALEHHALERARKSISALTQLVPPLALRRKGEALEEVPIERLEPGDVIVVRPNSKISADGVIVHGEGTVNQAPITGESMPVDKRPVADAAADHQLDRLLPEHRAFAGTINGNTALEVKVLRRSQDSTLSRLVQLVQEAEAQKSPTQHFTDKFESRFVPAVLLMVSLLLFAFLVLDETFQDSFYRAMSVLVAASPCALAISTPSAVLAGIARAARQGVLIKGGRPLEDLGSLSALAFDKTGTLTEGRPKLTAVEPAPGVDRKTLLTTAVAVENLSDHPLSRAIVEGGLAELGDVDIAEADDLTALTARGIRAHWKGHTVHVGNRRLFEELRGEKIPEAIDNTMSKLETAGNTAMIVGRDEDFLGVIAVMDVPRSSAKAVLSRLHEMGINRMVMLTGDHQQVAEAIARDIGISDPLGSLLPEDKVAAIERLKEEEGKVAMIGDGVNDAPAMARSTVGIAMGAAGSDVALETADIALMGDRLDLLPFAIGLSRQANRIIRQNLWISLGMIAILVPLTIFGIASLGPAVVAHEGSTLIVVLNALRLLGYKG